MRLRLFLLLCLLAALIGAVFTILKENPNEITSASFTAPTLQTLQHLVQKEIFAPPPLRRFLNRPSGVLTANGILEETNRHRALENLPTLQGDSVLNQAARNKLDDMLARQYFDHTNPSGAGPAEVVDGVGYAYVRVGENLALGEFDDDADLVQAWMESPGHKANIMSRGFSQLGVAVGRGTFENKPSWMAVQTFALPLASCPTVNPASQATFKLKQNLINQLAIELEDLETSYTSLAEQGQVKAQQGNQLIQQGNELAEQQKTNEEAQTMWDQGEQLQQQGQDLLNQASTARDTYNNKVAIYNQTDDEISALVDQLNAQIKAYNDCVSSF